MANSFDTSRKPGRARIAALLGACLTCALAVALLALLLQPETLVSIGRRLAVAATPDVAGAALLARVIVLATFNEVVVLGLGLALDRRLLRDPRMHGLLLASAAYAAVTPRIADLGTGNGVALAPAAWSLLAVVAASVAAQSGLWAQTFLVTGTIMDALRGKRPTAERAAIHWREGAGKAAVYAGCFMLFLHVVEILWHGLLPASRHAFHAPIAGAAIGAVAFPLVKTIVESFDGSAPFFRRLRASLRAPEGYVRGLVLGALLAPPLAGTFIPESPWSRFGVGALIGAIVYAGVDLTLDGVAIWRGIRRRLQSVRVYALGSVLGAGVGGALAWYFDPPQVAAVSAKLAKYVTIDYRANGAIDVVPYVIYPLFSKWGAMDLGAVAGGVRLFFNESLSGVINWSLAAPLFSINLVVLVAIVQRNRRPLQALFTRNGVIGLVEQAFRVQRWGLWMAPVIYSLLRLAPEPTWYNQDGAIRTLVAIGESARLGPDAFRQWSLELFLGLLAYDWLRVLIWFDHMGLRVATLVNASFVVGDLVDERSARFLGHSMRTRVIPEGIRRFATWGPLLIPFYLPRGMDWAYVWDHADVVRSSGEALLPPVRTLVFAYAAVAGFALVLASARRLRGSVAGRLSATRRPPAVSPLERELVLRNGLYTLEIRGDGRGFSHAASPYGDDREIDVTRRCAELGRPRGKFFYLREITSSGEPHDALSSTTFEPVRGDPQRHSARQISPSCLEFVSAANGLQSATRVTLAPNHRVELWSIRLTNLEPRPRSIEVTSYREFAVTDRDAYERHPAYHALHVGTCFVGALGAIFAHDRKSASGEPGERATAFHAVGHGRAGVSLVGYEDSRTLFVGAGTLQSPEALERSDFRAVDDEGLAFTFDPIASLQVRCELPARGSVEIRFVDGYAASELEAARLIAAHLDVPAPDVADLVETLARRRDLLDRHRLRPDETAYEFSRDGKELATTWDTSRPWHHVVANELSHGAVLGNDGSVFSFAGNAQQNGLTPFLPDSVPAQHLGQILYVVDLDTGRIHTPTHAPLRRPDVESSVVFGRGYATYESRTGDLTLELTVFVPPAEPLEVRIVRIRNRGSRRRRFRVVPYIELVLAELPRDSAGRLQVEVDEKLGAILFANPTNEFHRGQGFLAWSLPTEANETYASRFFGGVDRDQTAPLFVERASIEEAAPRDETARIAALSGTIEVEPGATGEVAILLGQSRTRAAVEGLVSRYADPRAASAALADTKNWWDRKLSALRIETHCAEMNRLVNDWLPYQVLTARLWARTGPDQRSGGFGFRDQLQDVLPLSLLDPAGARRQILLHASRQFLQGDVLQWWHDSWDGRVGLGARNHAADPHLWLVHVVDRYVTATGDRDILAERTPYVEGPSVRLSEGARVFVPRVSRDDATLYEHCRRAVERTIRRRGRHGLPLLERGDWNDGLDELGDEGRGESVWLGFFLYSALRGMERLAGIADRAADRAHYATEASRLAAALDGMWRDDHYVRLVADNGEEVSFASALMAAWPTLCGAADFPRSRVALEAGLARLEKDHLVVLLDPPFTESSRPYPGKIAAYPPGVRENGGQYSHGVSWLVDALVSLADRAEERGDEAASEAMRARAVALWRKISPIDHCAGERLNRYGLAPHQQAADVYFADAYAGRGGWSWYTGAAARMLSAAYAMLGIQFVDGRVVVANHARHRKGDLVLKRVLRDGDRIFPDA
jgi:cyclic beta-1,2-glucan synthetase